MSKERDATHQQRLSREQIEQRRGLLIEVLKRDGHQPDSVGIIDTNILCDMALSALSETALKPAEEMIEAGMEASTRGRPSIDDDSYVLSIWNAMINADRSGVKGSGDEVKDSRAAPPSARRCKWTLDTDGIYQTGCGNHFCYTDGTRTECTAKFCQACGGEIEGDE